MPEFERAAMVRFFMIASVVVLAGCQSVDTTKPGVVGVDRDQRMMVSSEEVNAGSAKAYAQMMAEAQKKGVLDRDPAMVKRVQEITKRLIPHTVAFRDDAHTPSHRVNLLPGPSSGQSSSGSIAANSSRLCRLCPDSSRSTWGAATIMPSVLG